MIVIGFALRLYAGDLKGEVAMWAAAAGLAAIGGALWWVRRPGDRLPDGVPSPDESGVVPANTVVVLSDNPIGVDSRTWGPYPADGMVGTTIKGRPRQGRDG
jgi:hypothetical protein